MDDKLLFPKTLKKGDLIGISAPASSFKQDLFYKGVEKIETMGFQAFIPKSIFNTYGYLAGSDLQRAHIIHELFENKKIKAIMCARGGYGTLRLLSLLNYDIIRKNPKIFIGFSDITTLLNVFYARCGLVTFHGPVITTLSNAQSNNIKSLFEILTSYDELKISLIYQDVIREGFADGPLLGGNLSVLSSLVGTPFLPDFNGHILLIEDVGEKLYRIDRMLMHMKLAGCFDGILGILLGSFVNCGNIRKIYNLFKEIFPYIPIVGRCHIGHGKNNMTIPIGLYASIDTNDMKILISKER